VRSARSGASARARLSPGRAARPRARGRVGAPVRGAAFAGGVDEPPARPLAPRAAPERGPRLHGAAVGGLDPPGRRRLYDRCPSPRRGEGPRRPRRGRDICARGSRSGTRVGARHSDSSRGGGMELQVKGKNLDVSESIRSYAERKLAKLEKQLHEGVRVEVEL